MTANEELAYIAGLIDGEGYIGIIKSRTMTDTHTLVPRVVIKMVDRQGIDLVHSRFGGYIYLRAGSGNARDAWTIQIANFDTVSSLLNSILPYLLIKKYQAELILKYISKRKRNAKRYTNEEWDTYYALRELNKTGRN